VKQIAVFLVVGAVTWCVYMASLAFGHQLMGWSDVLTISVAYVVTVSFHFTANRYFTFQAGQGRLARQLPRHGVLIVLNYALTLLLNTLLVTRLHWNLYFAASVVVVLTSALNFALSKYWIFAAR